MSGGVSPPLPRGTVRQSHSTPTMRKKVASPPPPPRDLCLNATLFHRGCNKSANMEASLAAVVVLCAIVGVLVRTLVSRFIDSHRRVLRDDFELGAKSARDENRALLLPHSMSKTIIRPVSP